MFTMPPDKILTIWAHGTTISRLFNTIFNLKTVVPCVQIVKILSGSIENIAGDCSSTRTQLSTFISCKVSQWQYKKTILSSLGGRPKYINMLRGPIWFSCLISRNALIKLRCDIYNFLKNKLKYLSQKNVRDFFQVPNPCNARRFLAFLYLWITKIRIFLFLGPLQILHL